MRFPTVFSPFSAAHPPMWLAIAACAVLTGCSEPTAPAQPPQARPALTATVRGGSAPTLTMVGEVRAAQRAELAFAVSGRVLNVHVQPGDMVRRGQLLVSLDEQPLRAQHAAAQGHAARTQAQLAEVRQRMERIRQARQAGAAGAGEWSAVQAELAAAEAAAHAAQAQQTAAQWSLDHAQLRAPMDGLVGARHVEPGQTVGPGAPVIAVDGNERELVAAVPAPLAPAPGQAVSLRSDSSLTPSRVLRVASRQEAGGTVQVAFAAPRRAVVGATWEVVLQPAAPTPAANAAVQVPLRAVVPLPEPGRGQVLRLAADGKTTERVDVQLGTTHGEWVGVTQGLAQGDQVIVAGAARIPPGTVVRPVAYAGGL